MGRLFDDRGNRMRPTHARKGGIKYRYYLSSALIEGRAEQAGSVGRAAAEIESVVGRSIREHLKLPRELDDKTVTTAHVGRVEVHPREIVIQMRGNETRDREDTAAAIRVTWQKQPSKRRREILLPTSEGRVGARPIRSETRATLIEAIARGRHWLDELIVDPQATAEMIAQRESRSPRKINMTISLAFLSLL
jgi:hypothetical protein